MIYISLAHVRIVVRFYKNARRLVSDDPELDLEKLIFCLIKYHTVIKILLE